MEESGSCFFGKKPLSPEKNLGKRGIQADFVPFSGDRNRKGDPSEHEETADPSSERTKKKERIFPAQAGEEKRLEYALDHGWPQV